MVTLQPNLSPLSYLLTFARKVIFSCDISRAALVKQCISSVINGSDKEGKTVRNEEFDVQLTILVRCGWCRIPLSSPIVEDERHGSVIWGEGRRDASLRTTTTSHYNVSNVDVIDKILRYRS